MRTKLSPSLFRERNNYSLPLDATDDESVRSSGTPVAALAARFAGKNVTHNATIPNSSERPTNPATIIEPRYKIPFNSPSAPRLGSRAFR